MHATVQVQPCMYININKQYACFWKLFKELIMMPISVVYYVVYVFAYMSINKLAEVVLL